ncbi:MAG: hypothetical protein ABIQ30_09770 [Devosia sp.]
MADKLQEQLGATARKLVSLKTDLAFLRLKLALKKYNPNQPRWS